MMQSRRPPEGFKGDLGMHYFQSHPNASVEDLVKNLKVKESFLLLMFFMKREDKLRVNRKFIEHYHLGMMANELFRYVSQKPEERGVPEARLILAAFERLQLPDAEIGRKMVELFWQKHKNEIRRWKSTEKARLNRLAKEARKARKYGKGITRARVPRVRIK